ncbi:hypothetical protein CEXT_746421 [Caerostris extrusa]|uniref:Secreted protein n=1 Tax=Caerostris extrusa TaxID=172846 RepID=A0AAV4QDY0_CAEEX|nr:hypothetical protein CEXT_746421 [Caerostris extrusa]
MTYLCGFWFTFRYFLLFSSPLFYCSLLKAVDSSEPHPSDFGIHPRPNRLVITCSFRPPLPLPLGLRGELRTDREKLGERDGFVYHRDRDRHGQVLVLCRHHLTWQSCQFRRYPGHMEGVPFARSFSLGICAPPIKFRQAGPISVF